MQDCAGFSHREDITGGRPPHAMKVTAVIAAAWGPGSAIIMEDCP